MEEEIKSEEKDEKKQEEIQNQKKPLDKMTVTELREIATKIPGVVGATGMKKEEVLAIIKKDRGIEDDASPKKGKGKTKKPTATVKELKTKIVALKEQKQIAREKRERKKIDILRRRINRIKKQTRKVAQG